MATDFTNNNTTISASGGLQPKTKNTPLDIRTRVNLKADIDSIPNPFVGMKILVLQDETNNNEMTEYVVVSLKANNLGMANSKVNEVVLAKDFLGVSGNGISEEQAQQLNTAYTHSQSVHVQQSDIPTKTSQLQNDSDFATNASVDEKIVNVSTGGQVDLTSYAKKTDLPTRTSQLTNDSGFLTNIPNEYVTETELNAKNYIDETELNAKGYAIKTEVDTILNNKVNIEVGKGLSTNDFTNDLKTKLDGIAEDAEVNVQSDWNVADTSSDAYILNKPDLTTYATKSFVSDEIAKAVTGGTIDLSGYAKLEDTGIKSNLITTEKSNLVAAINEISGKAKTNETAIATKSDKTYVDTELAKKVDKETGKSLILDTEIVKIHEHTNKGVLDNLTQTVIDNSHEHDNKAVLDGINTTKVQEWDDKLGKGDVINNLTSTIVNQPLSANQGKIIVDEWLGGKKLKYLTQAEYDLLSDTEKNDDFIVYNIIDAEGVQSDWSEVDISSDAYIKNKPTIPTRVTQLVDASNYATIAYVDEQINANVNNIITNTEIDNLMGEVFI